MKRQDQKARTRERILRSAGRVLRERGASRASLATIMARAGLTVGGFYAHFPSKATLVNETLRSAMHERRARFEGGPDWRVRVRTMMHSYLTRRHRDDAAGGCPLTAVVGDVARDGVGRTAMTAEIRALVDALQGDAVDPVARDAAIGSIALMSGGVLLARALGDTSFSDRTLRACQRFGEAALDGMEAADSASRRPCR